METDFSLSILFKPVKILHTSHKSLLSLLCSTNNPNFSDQLMLRKSLNLWKYSVQNGLSNPTVFPRRTRFQMEESLGPFKTIFIMNDPQSLIADWSILTVRSNGCVYITDITYQTCQTFQIIESSLHTFEDKNKLIAQGCIDIGTVWQQSVELDFTRLLL